MPSPPLQQPRINLGELKSQIATKVGPERAKRYFSYLNQLLSQKLSKHQFTKHCLSILGREFIHLHNHLIHSILGNAILAKSPPQQSHENTPAKNLPAIGKKTSADGGSNLCPAPATQPVIWSNGNILPPSPRKVRSGMRERRIKDLSPLGQNSGVNPLLPQALVSSEVASKENGIVGPCDSKRPEVHHRQGEPAEKPAKKPRVEGISMHDKASVHHKYSVEVTDMDGREEDRSSSAMCLKRDPLQAPLGIPFCLASVGGAQRSSPLQACTSSSSNFENGELCQTDVLWIRMERMAVAQGLGAVTTDCANLLNNGLDAYLKRLVRSCVDLVGARSGNQSINNLLCKKQGYVNLPNGILPRNHMNMQKKPGSSDATNELKILHTISLEDFKVAMELNPRQLGEDWPLLLEKICHCSFEE